MSIQSNPHVAVTIDGQTFDSWRDRALIKQVTIALNTDRASEAMLRVFDPDFKFIDKFAQTEGVPTSAMKFFMGFGANLGDALFTGVLARVERSDTDTTIRAYDLGFKMRQILHTGYHRGKDDIGIIKSLAEQSGLKFEGPASDFKLEKHRSYIQDAESDWQLASERAHDAGLVLFVRNDTLYAKEPAKTGTPVVILTHKKDFVMLPDFDLSYRVPENPDGRPSLVEKRGRGRRGRRLSGKSEQDRRGTQHAHIKADLAIHTKSWAQRRAHASKALQREHAFSCSVKMSPDFTGVRPDVRNTVALQGLGLLFSGLYLVDRAVHDFVPGTLVTSLDLYRDIRI